MKKNVNYIKNKKIIHYTIIIIIGILVTIPFLWMQIKTTDDGKFHLLRLIGLDNAFKYSSFPFLVFPFFCNDWGYSMMAFYPPIVTYIPYILGIISGTFANGLKIFAGLTTILSGIFMYNFINEVTKKKGIALFSAIFYMIFPYRFEDVFNRYAIGEFSSFVFIPIVFQGLYNLLHGDKKRHYYITIGATGLLLTHNISTLYTAIFCLIYVLINIKKFLNIDVIKKCIINVIFTLLLSALFLVPMLEFKSQADYTVFNSAIMRTDSKSVAKNAIEPWQFLKDKEVENPLSFVIGIPFITLIIVGILVYSKIDKKYKDFYKTSLLLGIISLFMCTKYFPWIIMPNFLCNLQYSWRLLGFAIFFLMPVCAINLYYLINPIRKEWIRNILYIFVIIVFAMFTVKKLQVYRESDITQDIEYENSNIQNPQIHYFSINRDYIPVNSLVEQKGYLWQRDNKTKIIYGNVETIYEEKFALHMEVNLKNAERGTRLELPYFFYPGYNINLLYNNMTIPLKYIESDYGFIEIEIPEDISEGKIILDYTATTLDKISYLISAVSLIGFVIYVIIYRKKYKKENELIQSENKKE